MSSIEDCGVYNEFSYYFVNGKCILGDNSTSAFISGKTCPKTIIIPPKVNDNPVLEIGCNAIYNLVNLRELIILARITQINSRGIYSCPNLEKVNVPNTCLYIFYSGIHMWNHTLGNHVPNPGTTNVTFEPNTQIAYISYHGIVYRENINIFFCNKVNLTTNGDPFQFSNTKLYSPYSYRLTSSYYVNSIQNLPSICNVPQISLYCKKNNHKIVFKILFILISETF